jgi:hypothetical protein
VQRYVISGRFDRPYTSLILCRPGSDDEAYHWWGGNMLSAMHCFDNVYYRLRATPTGDKLTVEPYKGDRGVFKVGPGGRELDKMTVRGSLGNLTRAVVVGKLQEDWPEPVEQAELPVGDYTARTLSFELGKLRVGLSSNYHADGKPRGRDGEPIRGIKIRNDKPFIFDFSNKPAVMFASPARNQQFKPGEEIGVKGVLIDPTMDLMIRDLDDTSQKEEEELHFGDGEKHTITRDKSLDPTVTITDSAGKPVAEGVMPFG